MFSINFCDLCQIFVSRLRDFINQCTVVETIPRRHQPIKPWISRWLCREIQKKNELYKRAKRHPTNQRLREYSKRISKKVKALIAQARDSYFRSKLERNRHDYKKCWNIINEITQRTKSSMSINSIMATDGSIRTEKLEICNEFNRFFVNVSDRLISDLETPKYYRPCERNSNCSFFFRPTTAYEVLGVIRDLKTCAPGKDDISADTLKRIAFNVVDVLAFLVNLSFTTGTFPATLKEAIVLPFFKKGDDQCMSNYRPISLLTVLSKVFEKLAHRRMYDFLVRTSFFAETQFGFMPGRNCEDALLKVTGELWAGINSEGVAENMALFLDLTKAFDLVDHRLLVGKLEGAGFRGVAIEWLSSYIYERTQRVRIPSGCLSDPERCTSGVPQGSVLGPLLFLIYINSLLKMDLAGSITAYADDVTLVYAGKNSSDIMRDIKADLKSIGLWLAFHKMVMSSKTVAMTFGRSDDVAGGNLICHSSRCLEDPGSGTSDCTARCVDISFVTSYKYLGVLLDCELNWIEHTKYLRNNIRSLNRQLYRLRTSCSSELLRLFYTAIGESRLRYGLLCWGGTAEVAVKPLYTSQKAQKACIRTMSFARRCRTSKDLFAGWNLLPLRCLYVYRVSEFYFKNCGDHVYFIRENNPRRSEMLILPRPRSEAFRRYFAYFAPLIVNNLREFVNPVDPKKIRWLLMEKGIDCLHRILTSRYV